MHKLALKVPPVVVFLVATLSLYLCALLSKGGYSLYEYRLPLMLASLFLGIIIGVVAVLTFKKVETTVNPMSPDKASHLVTNGIFKYTRNPMYLALVLALISASFYFDTNPVLGVLVLIGFIIYMTQFQIKPEEKMLTQLFGQVYVDYMHSTRRWL